VRPIKQVVGTSKSALSVTFSDTQEYRTTTQAFAEVLTQMSSGEVVSVLLRVADSKIRYGLIEAPFFAGWPRSRWRGVIEYAEADYQWIWNVVISSVGLQLACVGFEETPELTDANLSPTTFPWDDRQLVVGAVRTPSSWTIRNGVRYLEVSKLRPRLDQK
jgi:hypothetical protein